MKNKPHFHPCIYDVGRNKKQMLNYYRSNECNDICRTFHLPIIEYILFCSAYGTCHRIEHMLDHRISF